MNSSLVIPILSSEHNSEMDPMIVKTYLIFSNDPVSWIKTTSGLFVLEVGERKLGQNMIVHDYDSFHLDLYEVIYDLVCDHVTKYAQDLEYSFTSKKMSLLISYLCS